jgi:hypothetical protein
MLWTEPTNAAPQDRIMTDAFSVVKHGETAYTEIRRFIIILNHVNFHSICV